MTQSGLCIATKLEFFVLKILPEKCEEKYTRPECQINEFFYLKGPPWDCQEVKYSSIILPTQTLFAQEPLPGVYTYAWAIDAYVGRGVEEWAKFEPNFSPPKAGPILIPEKQDRRCV